jgi:hypothetical protein
MTSTRPARLHARPRGRPGIAGRAVVVAVCLAIALSGAAAGASPGPSANPNVDLGETNVEAWLDVPVPSDVTVGEPYAFGVTMWDATQQTFARFNEGYVRLRPAKGSAKPTIGSALSDWPGHLIGDVVVPRGGPGPIEIGIADHACAGAGSCSGHVFPFKMAGTGPPPNAPRSALIVATIQAPAGSLFAGEPIDLSVSVEPQAGWDLDALGLPNELVAFVSTRSGPDLASATLHDTGERGASPSVTYSGQITIPVPGNMSLQVAIPGNGSEDQVLRGASIRLDVGGTAIKASSPPAAQGAAPSGVSGDPWSRWPLYAGGLALVLVAAFVIRRVFADL